MSKVVKGIYQSVRNPKKWFNWKYQSDSANVMVGGQSAVEADRKQEKAVNAAAIEQKKLEAVWQAESLAVAAQEAAKAAAEKLAADQAAAAAAEALARRKRATTTTPSGARGVLGAAPVRGKVLLGQ